MALALNKILIAGTNTNTPGAYFQTVNLSGVGVGNSTAGLAAVIPAGVYIYTGTTNVTVEINLNTGNTTTWTTYLANGASGIIISDGQNVRANAASGTAVITLNTVNGGEGIAGKFANV